MRQKKILRCVVCRVEAAPKDHMCEAHRKMAVSGFVALVEVINGAKGLKASDAVYTGKHMHIARKVFLDIFENADPRAEVCFVSVGVIDRLTNMYESIHGVVPKIGEGL